MTGQFLAALRVHYGFTQGQLAKACGVPQPRISEWEIGVHKVPKWMPYKLAELGCITTVFDGRLPQESDLPATVRKQVRALWKQRNVAPDAEVEGISEQIILLLLPHTSAT